MKNLQQAPTREELEKIGFEPISEGKESLKIHVSNMILYSMLGKDLIIIQELVDGNTSKIGNPVPLTKEEINKAYELFGLEPPFEVVAPKKYEVWQNLENGFTIMHIEDNIFLSLSNIGDAKEYDRCYLAAEAIRDFTKTHDTIEEYFAEKNKKRRVFREDSEEVLRIDKRLIAGTINLYERRTWLANYLNEILNK